MIALETHWEGLFCVFLKNLLRVFWVSFKCGSIQSPISFGKLFSIISQFHGVDKALDWRTTETANF